MATSRRGRTGHERHEWQAKGILMETSGKRHGPGGDSRSTWRVRGGWLAAALALILAAVVTASAGSCSQAGLGAPDCRPFVPLPAALAVAGLSLVVLWKSFSRR